MSAQVFRYQLVVEDFPEVLMPRDARVLSVAPSRQGDNPRVLDLWALVDPSAPTELRRFRVVGTGNLIGGDLGRFIGTVSLLGGAFIGHVFEAGEPQ